MNVFDYIQPEFIILVIACGIIGAFLKQSRVRDELIPVCLFIFGILVAATYLLATIAITSAQDVFMIIFVAITQGTVCAGASIGVNQLVKQTSKYEAGNGLTK